MEAFKSLYGTSRKGDVNLKEKKKNATATVILPEFAEITQYIYTELDARFKDTSKRISVGNHMLPLAVDIYVEASKNKKVLLCISA